MKEHPILFSGPMVRAILEGRKTQTRRVLKTQPLEILEKARGSKLVKVTRQLNGHKAWFGLTKRDPNQGVVFRCSYGEIGDRLWVRETWGDVTLAFQSHECEEPKVIAFRADDAVYETENMSFLEHRNDSGIVVRKWKPSIFLPRAFSRVTLEITNVRVERLQEIGTPDIKAEGILPPEYPNGTYIAEFDWEQRLWREGWDKINGKRKGCAWADNPWVWVIEFRKVDSHPSKAEGEETK